LSKVTPDLQTVKLCHFWDRCSSYHPINSIEALEGNSRMNTIQSPTHSKWTAENIRNNDMIIVLKNLINYDEHRHISMFSSLTVALLWWQHQFNRTMLTETSTCK